MTSHDVSFGPSPHVSASIHPQGVVLLHVMNGRLFTANQTGAEIWMSLEKELSTTQIAEDLSRRYRIPLTTAHAHTTRFIAQLAEGHLIEQRMG